MNNTISKNMARNFVAYLTTRSQIALVGSILGFGFIGANSAQAVTLGAAADFAVLGGTAAVVNTGLSVITGDLGYGTAVTGFPPGTVNGAIRTGADLTAARIAAQAAQAAYTALANLPLGQNLTYAELASLSPNQNLTGLDLARTLNAGVYFFGTTAALTGNLSLDAQNISNARFVFQIGTALNTAAISSVSLFNGADARNVFFLVGTSATLGAGTQFTGNIIALADISIGANSQVNGNISATDITIGADSRVNGNTIARGDITIGASNRVNGNTIASGALTIGASNQVTGDISAGGALTIGASSRVTGNTSAGGALTIGASNQVTGDIRAGGALTIGADNQVTGNTSAGGALTIGASSRVNGNTIARGDISIGASNQVTGNTIARDITYGADSRVNGNIIASGDITIGARSNIECGSVLAGGAVTLDSNRITTCGRDPAEPIPESVTLARRGIAQPVPEPLTIVGTLIGATAAFHMRKKLKPASKVELNQLC